MPKPKLAILLGRFPYPLEKGDKLRAYHQIVDLSKDFDIYLIAIVTKSNAHYYSNLQPYCAAIQEIIIPQWLRIFNTIKSFFSKKPLQVGYSYSTKANNKVQALLQQWQPSLVYIQLARMAKYAQAIPFKKVLDYQDAFSSNYARSIHQSSGFTKLAYIIESKRIKKYEQLIAPMFNATTIITHADKDALQLNNCTVVGNGVDTNYFVANNATKQFDVAFVGNMGYYPNVEAAHFIIEKILPLLQKVKPNIKILIAGANAQKIKNNTTAITIKAWLPDIRDAYAQSTIFVAPMFSGAGLQNKLLEAMAMQVPCITTAISYNALLPANNTILLQANTAEQFVQNILLLLEDKSLYSSVQANALQYIQQQYSWEQHNHRLSQLLQSIIH